MGGWTVCCQRWLCGCGNAKREERVFNEELELFDKVHNTQPPQNRSPAELEKALSRLRNFAARIPYNETRYLDLHLRIAMGLHSLGRRRLAILEWETMEAKYRQAGNRRAEALCCTERGLLLSEDLNDEEESMRVLLRGVPLALENCGDGGLTDRMKLARFMLGKLLYFHKDFENVIRYLCLDGIAKPDSAHFYLGMCHRAIGRKLLESGEHNHTASFEVALNHYQSCVELNQDPSTIVRARGAMADTYALLQDYEKARQAFAETAKFAQESGDFEAASRAWWCCGSMESTGLGRHEDAAESFISALEVAFKIEDETKHAQRLLDASTWLNKTLRHLQGYSQEDYHRTAEEECLPNSPLPDMHLKQTRAEALRVLGAAKHIIGKWNEACLCFQDAVKLITDEQTSSCREGVELGLFYRVQWGLAELLSAELGEYIEALKIFQTCKGIASSEQQRLKCDTRLGFVLKGMGNYDAAFATFTQALEEYSTLLETLWDMMVELLMGLGQTLQGLGDWNAAIAKMEAARKILEEKEVFQPELMDLTYSVLFNAYVEKQQFWVAFQVAHSFQTVLRKHGKESSQFRMYQLMSAMAYSSLADVKVAEKSLEAILRTQSNTDWQLRCGTLGNLASVYRKQGDFQSALDKYDELLQQLPAQSMLFIVHTHVNCAGVYAQMAEEAMGQPGKESDIAKNNGKALAEYDKAINIIESCLPHPDAHTLAISYAGQATILVRMKDTLAASEKLEKARGYAGSDGFLVPKLKYIQAHLYGLNGACEEAEAETREAALLYAALQVELQDLEHAWISLLGGEMKHVFFFMQTLLVNPPSDSKPSDYTKALLWAERGRMRLYSYLMEQHYSFDFPTQQIQREDPLWFDKDDGQAQDWIHQAIRHCGLGTAVVVYTLAESEGFLYEYVVKQDSKLSVDFQLVRLRDFFAKEENSKMGKTVDKLISETRYEIMKCSDDNAKLGLGILYTLLVDPVWQFIEGCNTVIFAPHERLSLVPFAALYDRGQEEFLIEQKAVGIIPSIRVLGQCFLQQSAYEKEMQMDKLAPPFVAGGPEPMGLGLLKLEGATKEAEIVAEKLGVEPLVGFRMSKKAVIDGMNNARVVVLVTHGIVNPHYPYGALVMQGQYSQEATHGVVWECSPAPVLRSLVRKLGMRDAVQAISRASEVLTAEEIQKLDGGIRAGLVVLSACETGGGEVSSEGLLGLGRAVLQKGASAVVLTLWKVDDNTTKDLVTGLFQHLVDGGQNLVMSMQSAMLGMLRSGFHIYKWAPLIAFGSPTVRVMKYSS